MQVTRSRSPAGKLARHAEAMCGKGGGMDRLTQSSAPTGDRCRGLVRWQPVPEPRLRLFCLPHAGGGAITYRHWAERLAPDIEGIAIRLPGRASRLGEPPLRAIPDIVAAVVPDVGPWLDRPPPRFG